MTVLQQICRRLLLGLASLLPLTIRRWLALRPLAPARRRLALSMSRARPGQELALLRIIEANRRTEFGRAHAFDQIRDAASFVARVPLRTYSELEPFIERQRRGESGVLCADTPLGFTPIAGHLGQRRSLPVTPASLADWSWAEDLLLAEAIRHRPAVARGCLLHLLPLSPPSSAGSPFPLLPLPVLARIAGRAPPALPDALPWQICNIRDEATRFYLLLRLAAGRPVTMLRAASPGTLRILAEHLERLGEKLLEDVSSGRVDHLDELPEEVQRSIAPPRPDPRLAARLRRGMTARGRLEPRDLWPGVELLVCATTGPALAAAERLSDHFGGLPLLDPGHNGAEGLVTLPWLEGEGGPLALESSFLEFLPLGGDSATRTMLQLIVGERVRPVITSPSGLYRFHLEDILEVVAVEQGLARLVMLGRIESRLRLEEGPLREEEVSEAIAAGSRTSSAILRGCTTWLEPAGPAAAPPAKLAPRGFWARLLGRARPPSPPAPALSFALELAQPLARPQAELLLAALEGELRRGCPAYEAGRASSKLARPVLLLLRAGTFARRSHQLLAEGAPEAHLPVPALCEAGSLPISPEDVEAHLELPS